MIFCGGMVMTIDDEMPLACEELAGVVNHKDTMGICCFGEQGVGPDHQAKHGNLMFGCLAFLNHQSKKSVSVLQTQHAEQQQVDRAPGGTTLPTLRNE